MALLIQKQDTRKNSHFNITLPPDVAEDLAAYAAMTESAVNHIVCEALRHVFARDRKDLTKYKQRQPKGTHLAPVRSKNFGESPEKIPADDTKNYGKTA